jgi:Fur family transcriptional regulator, ferric uptake regulator
MPTATRDGRSPTDEVLEALRRGGFRMTPQRFAIVAEVMAARGHISPAAVARRVQARLPGVNPSTIYRTLGLLEELGVLAHAHLERGAEYHLAEEAEHVHLSCARCGRQDDLSAGEAHRLQRAIAEHQGFRADLTHFAISGLCRACQRSGAREQAGRHRANPGSVAPPS